MRTMNVMTASDITTPLAKEEIAAVARRLATATTKGDLLRMLAEEAGRYTLADLQVIGGRLFMEVAGLPEPYRSRVRPFFCEQLFGAHHRLLLMYRSGAFRAGGRANPGSGNVRKILRDDPGGLFYLGRTCREDAVPLRPAAPALLLPYGRIYDVCSRFPGPSGRHAIPGRLCGRGPERDVLLPDPGPGKEVFFSICNFCPAKQSEENAPVKNAANPFR